MINELRIGPLVHMVFSSSCLPRVWKSMLARYDQVAVRVQKTARAQACCWHSVHISHEHSDRLIDHDEPSHTGGAAAQLQSWTMKD